VCDVVWAGADSGDDALPCGLVGKSTPDAGSLRVSHSLSEDSCRGERPHFLIAVG
jgi:hypothetical protein